MIGSGWLPASTLGVMPPRIPAASPFSAGEYAGIAPAADLALVAVGRPDREFEPEQDTCMGLETLLPDLPDPLPDDALPQARALLRHPSPQVRTPGPRQAPGGDLECV